MLASSKLIANERLRRTGFNAMRKEQNSSNQCKNRNWKGSKRGDKRRWKQTLKKLRIDAGRKKWSQPMIRKSRKRKKEYAPKTDESSPTLSSQKLWTKELSRKSEMIIQTWGGWMEKERDYCGVMLWDKDKGKNRSTWLKWSSRQKSVLRLKLTTQSLFRGK